MRTNKGNSSSNQQNSRQQPPASIPPPPPPPLPPIQHHRGRNDYGNSRGYQSNRDNYGRHSNLETIADQLAVEHLLTIIEPEIKVTETIETQEEMKREMLTVLVDEDTIRDRDIKRVICQVK